VNGVTILLLISTFNSNSIPKIHNDWMKVHSHLQYSCSPQHFSFKSFILQNTLCGFAKPGAYLFSQWFWQRISCVAVFQRDQTWTWTEVMKHWSIRNPILPLHQLKLSLATTKFGYFIRPSPPCPWNSTKVKKRSAQEKLGFYLKCVDQGIENL